MYELKPIRVFISTSMILSILLPSLFLTGDTNSLSEKQKKDKRVIEFGWDIPDTEFVKNNISEIEKKPFNGVVLNVKYNNQDKYLESIAFSNIYLQYEGVWWLISTDQGSYFNLFVWYAPDLLGPWKPHAANPVKTDIRSVRPAGTPFMYNSYLYRPTQDCSRTYGGRTVLNRVTRLTPTEFKEELAAVIEPYTNSPFPDGVHTISAVGDITLIDGKRFIFIGSAFKRVLIGWFTKILTTLSNTLRAVLKYNNGKPIKRLRLL